MLLDRRRNEIVKREYVDSLKNYKGKKTKKGKAAQNSKTNKESLSTKSFYNEREEGGGKTQVDQKQVSLLHLKGHLDLWSGVAKGALA